MVCGPAWSLGSELTFYLLAPWLARLRYSYQIGLFLLGLIVHLAAIALFGVTGDPWSFKFFPFSLDYFILGSLAYQFYAQAEVTLAKWKPFFSNYGRYCVYGIVIMYSRLPSHAEQRFFIAVPLFCLILPFLFYATKDMKLDRIIGELSYPFYLCHKLILLIFWPWIAAYCPANFCGAVLTLITILFSWILYRCFEAPIEKWRHQALTKVVEKFELTDRTIPGDVT
jgi:peptidoglycan/LPS O-acetylase OafA/YrhL